MVGKFSRKVIHDDIMAWRHRKHMTYAISYDMKLIYNIILILIIVIILIITMIIIIILLLLLIMIL